MPEQRLSIALATRNAGKAEEFASLFANMPLDFLTMNAAGYTSEIDETGTTFAENALLKARALYDSTGLPSLGDDSGLECDALGGVPGIYSARYAGNHCSDSDNAAKLLMEMKSVTDEKRTARFRCVLAYIDGRGEHFFEGVCEGRIARKRRGSSGFGYDPVFIPAKYSERCLTFAMLTPDEKNEISHRGAAAAKLKSYLEKVTFQGDDR